MDKDRLIELEEGKDFFRRKVMFLIDNTNGKFKKGQKLTHIKGKIYKRVVVWSLIGWRRCLECSEI